MDRLGIKNANLSTLKHTFASYLMMRSGIIKAIQKLLGHKSIRTIEIDAHLNDKNLHHVVSMLSSANLVTDLIMGNKERVAKLLKTKEWAIEDSNLRLLPCVGITQKEFTIVAFPKQIRNLVLH